MLTHTSPSRRFGIFEVNLQTGELRRKGQKVKLQDQPFQVLAALMERPGEGVTREELRSKLWPADTFVDFDHSLNAAIKRLRDALGESADAPLFIETMARRGYRFIGNVEATVPISSRPIPLRWLFTRRAAALGAIAACALALSFVYYSRSSSSKARRPATALDVIPVVTNVGEKYTPSLSPDGQHLAFAWNGGSGPAFSIYVKLVGTEDLLRLTKRESSIDFNPAWSPDGRYVAFCRILERETGIYIIPALGGTERRVRETLWQERKSGEILWSAGRLSWSPDGKLLAFSDGTSRSEFLAGREHLGSSIFLLSLDSLEVRRLSSPLHSIGVSNLAFSPDGRTLAFTKVSQAFDAIYAVPVSGGEERRLVSDGIFHWGLAWTPDGRNVVFQSGPVNAGWLWKVPFPGGGEPERLQFSQEGIEPAIRGNRLVYVHQTANINIWRRNLNSLVAAGSPDRVISSTKMESGPQFSPDGTKIAFESNRSGAYEVWM